MSREMPEDSSSLWHPWGMYKSNINIPGYKHDGDSAAPFYYNSISSLPRVMRHRAANMRIRFGNATEKTAIFTSWPIVQSTDTSKEAEITTGSGSHLPTFQGPITMVVPPGTFSDTELPYDVRAHQQIRVRVGVLQDLSSDEANSTGRLQFLDDKFVSGNKILVLRQPCLELPSQFPSIPWPCDSETITSTTFSSVDDHASVTSESIGHEMPGEALHPPTLKAERYEVGLELQECSLEQDINATVTISQQVHSVECRTEHQDRTLSEKYRSGVMFREDKPALLRFFLGLAEDFLSEGVTDPQSMDEEIDRTVREWYTPLWSPDGIEDWMSLRSNAIKFCHEGKDREVWVETPLRHFSKVAKGVKIDIPGYKHDKDSPRPVYNSVISRWPRKMRSRAANLTIRFGNATEKCATFTYWPIIEITNRRKEREIGTGVLKGDFTWGGQSEVTCNHLSAFQEPLTAIVPSGTYQDREVLYDIKAHQQIRVKVGVLKDLSSSEPNATGKLQLAEELYLSRNTILVLQRPALHKPSQFSPIPWPCDAETIKNARS